MKNVFSDSDEESVFSEANMMASLSRAKEIIRSDSNSTLSQDPDEIRWRNVILCCLKEVRSLPDNEISIRQRFHFDVFAFNAYHDTPNFSMESRLMGLILLATHLDCDSEVEGEKKGYLPIIEKLFHAWFECMYGKAVDATPNVHVWVRKCNGRPSENQIKRHILRAFVRCLLDEETDDLLQNYTECDAEEFEWDISFAEIKPSLMDDINFKRKYMAIHDMFSIRDGKIVFDHIQQILATLLSTKKPASMVKSYYMLRNEIDELQKLLPNGIKEWRSVGQNEAQAAQKSNYKTYDDLPRELQKEVLNKDKFNQFVVALNEELVKTLEGKNKSVWDVVLFVSNYLGIFDKTKRRAFAQIVTNVVDNWNESETTLFSSMEKCSATTGKDFLKYESYPISSKIRNQGDPILNILIQYIQ